MSIQKVIHLTHTDINYDSRILKEMNALSGCGKKYSIYGVGVSMNEGNSVSSQSRSLRTECINLKSRRLKSLPVALRHSLSLIELIGKMSIRAIMIRPNIVHSHDTLVLPLCVFIKMMTGSKLIYDAHELESNRNGLSPILSRATYLAEKILWPFVDYLITVSPSIQKWYQINIGTKPSKVILNSPIVRAKEENNLTIDNNYLRRKFGITVNEKIFIYVGLFAKGRGIRSLLDIFSNMPEAHLIFMGYGELLELITKHADFYENIHLHPAVPHEDVINIIRSADVGLCIIENVALSDYFCLPNKLFEYCFAGIPVIASDFPDIIGVVDEFNLGVCCGQDIESIRNAIEIFVNNTNKFPIDIEKLEELGWEAQKLKLLDAYEEVSSLNINCS